MNAQKAGEQTSEWEPPVADPGLMLGINPNVVPGGNPIVLQKPRSLSVLRYDICN